MAHKHPVYDTDAHFLIDPNSRDIKNQSGKTTIIQHDHNSERFSFEINNEIDGHPVMLCNVVQIHYINIDATTKAESIGVYEVDDMQISPDDENVVVLTWLISNNATRYAGSLNFIVKFKCVADDGSVDYVWNSGICKRITISNGMDNGEEIVEEYADILEKWRQELIESGGASDEQIASAVESYMAEHPADGTGTVKSINGVEPDENGNVDIALPDGSGSASIHVGPEPPTDGSNVWIDTNEEESPEFPPEESPDGFVSYEPSDWNASEGQPGHVLNRTHWTDREETEYFPEGTYNLEGSNEVFVEGFAKPIEVGKKYAVNFDGTTYELFGATNKNEGIVNDYGEDFAYIGNLAMFLSFGGTDDSWDEVIQQEKCDTGEPFCFVCYLYEDTGEGQLLISNDYASTQESVVFGIVEVDETVHKLPDQYLPDYLPRVETAMVEVVFDGDMTGLESMLVDENGAYAVKVSSNAVSVEELIGSTLNYFLTTDGDTSLELTAETAADATTVLGVPGSVVLSSGSPVVISLPEDATIQGVVLSAGTWFMCIPSAFYVKSLSCLVEEKEVIQKMDSAYLPPFGVNAEPFTFTGLDSEKEYHPGGYAYFTPTDAMKEQIESGVIKMAFNFKGFGATNASNVSVVLTGDVKYAYGNFVKNDVRYGVTLKLETSINFAEITFKPEFYLGLGSSSIYPIANGKRGTFYFEVDADGNVIANALS